MLEWINDSGRMVTIVSNNSESAIRQYLEDANLAPLVDGIAARLPDNVGRVKPHTHLLQRAMTARGTEPERCVMIGDSATDIAAAAAADMPTIAYADKADRPS